MMLQIQLQINHITESNIDSVPPFHPIRLPYSDISTKIKKKNIQHVTMNESSPFPGRRGGGNSTAEQKYFFHPITQH